MTDKNDPFTCVRVVMINTTEAGNIGAAARAMKNMCLSRLYLVKPKDFPSAAATARASSADDVLANAVVCEDLATALQGVNVVIGTSARKRSNKWQQLNTIKSCALIAETVNQTNQQVAVVFGSEKSGLTNEQLDLCHILMHIDGNADYFSLNVAAAVQIFAYQLFNELTEHKSLVKNSTEKASFEKLERFYQHLEQVLTEIDYIDHNKPVDKFMRRLRCLFNRALLEDDEVKILRGMLSAMQKKSVIYATLK